MSEQPINRIDEDHKETVALQIILMPDGSIKVVSPLITDKMAYYGLLEVAKDAIKELHAPKIVKPVGGIMNFARGK